MSFNLDEDIVKSILKIGDKYKINRITLFGSRARGDNKKTSDIDLAVYCDETYNDKSSIYFDLEDIDTLPCSLLNFRYNHLLNIYLEDYVKA